MSVIQAAGPFRGLLDWLAVPPIAPEFGPTMPQLVRARLGIPPLVTLAAVAALVIGLGVVMVTVQPSRAEGRGLLHEGTPVFNLIYDDAALREVAPRRGELVRLEGRRGRQAIAISIRPLDLPPYEGDVAHGLLPVYASRHIDALAARIDRFRLVTDARARLGDAPGYEVGFRSGPARRPTYGSDVILVPSDTEPDGALLLSLRRTVSGRAPLGEAGRRFTAIARDAVRSFNYGRGRPEGW